MQSTQSNGTVFFRAAVMAGFLAVIFYAALSGNALPDAARKSIEKYLPKALASNKSPTSDAANASSAAATASEAPLFNGPQTKPALGMNSASMNSAAPPLMENPSAPRTLAMDRSASPLAAVPNAGAQSAPWGNGPSPVVPVNYLAQAESSTPNATNTPGIVRNAILPENSSLPLTSFAGTTPFAQIQDRLKQLGATYYLLETWGNQQQLYRFYCKMAVGGNTNYTHCFEYISADPMQAMSEVLKQVESWHSAGATAQ
jgi:hypothetical protein